eukprot:5978235-Pleurochrysis_carterae.AAC.1
MLHELLVLRRQRACRHRRWPHVIEHHMIARLTLPSRVVYLCHRVCFYTSLAALVLQLVGLVEVLFVGNSDHDDVALCATRRGWRES